MAAPESSVYSDALIFLGAAVVAVPLFRYLRLGSILGYLAAGLAIGPFGLGLFSDVASVMHIAELGVVLFLFVIGLELNLSRLWAMRSDIFGLGTLQVLVSGGLGMLYPLLVAGRPWQAALIAGLGLSLSSTALVMQLLGEKGELQSRHGQKAFAILLLQDLAVVPLLALVSLLSPDGGHGAGEPWWLSLLKAVLAVGTVVVAGRYLLNPLFRLLARAGAHEIMTAAALLVVIAAATLMTFAGLSPALGAFLAGILLAESTYRHELEADIEPFRGLLLGLFFISVGMTVDLGVVVQGWKVLLGAVVVVTGVKTGVVYGLMRLLRNDHTSSLRTALYLPQGGEFGFVLYSTAVAVGVMQQEQASLLVVLVTLTMALTPLLVSLGERLEARAPAREREEDFAGAQGSVLIIGFGRFGQVLSQLLLPEGIDVTTIDNDVEMIEAAERFGFKVYYGDGTRLDVLRAAGIERAQLVCVCVDSRETANRIVDIVRAICPLSRLYVRSYDRGHSLELVKKGVDFELRETYESAVAFGRAALAGLGLPPERIAEIEEDMRQRDRERFALQQQGDIWAGGEKLVTRPTPKPQPLTEPRRRAVALNPAEAPRPPPPESGQG